MAREYFCAYHSYLKSMRNLTDAECGRLFRALLKYSAGDTSINLQGRESIAFDFISEQIDRDNDAYNAKCEMNRRNGSLANGSERPRTVANAPERTQTPPDGSERDRTEANGSERPRTVANGSEWDQTVANAPQGKGKGKGKGKEEYSPCAEPLEAASTRRAGSKKKLTDDSPEFKAFWQAYPRKNGKGDARNALAKALTKTDLNTILAAVAMQSRSEQWNKDGGQFIPYPATWLNQERWGDDMTALKKRGRDFSDCH